MEQLVLEKSLRINETLPRLLQRTQIVASLISLNDGNISGFEQLASTLVDDPAILNMLLAPGGVVSYVYPMAGNEAVLGLDFFYQDTVHRGTIPYETLLLANIAKETRELVMGGPFTSVQGYEILVGRKAVFLEDDVEEYFWGIVGITFKHPDALEGARLDDLALLGFDYELWRIDPYTNERRVIAASAPYEIHSQHYIDIPVNFLNVNWYFRVLSVSAWYSYPATWLSGIVGLIISIMGAAITKNYEDLKVLKNKLQQLSSADPLTGIYNRRHFMETAKKQLDRVTRHNKESFIIILDLDHFKKVNDTYGHQSGDFVLIETAARISTILRPYDIFARFGGEEFILFISDANKDNVMRISERICQIIAQNPFQVMGKDITVTASLGVASIAPGNTLESAIAFADQALYKAKEEGRNRVNWRV